MFSFGYCTGGTVYVVSFPPFYNMLESPRAYEVQESRRVIHSCTVTPKYHKDLISQQTDQRSLPTGSSALELHIANTHRGLEVSLRDSPGRATYGDLSVRQLVGFVFAIVLRVSRQY